MRSAIVFSTFIVVVSLAGPAAAQEVPICPSGEDSATTTVPDYLRVGESYTLSLETYDTLSDVNVTVDGLVTPLTQEGATYSAVLPGPAKTGSVKVDFSWNQDLGTSRACRGSDTYDIPVIGARGKAGRVDYPRVSGRYRVTYRNGNIKLSREDRNAFWQLTPACRYFGCSTKLNSNGGLKGTFYAAGSETYELYRSRGSGGYCDVRSLITGEVTRIKPAFYMSVRYELRATKTAKGIATKIAGKRVVRADIATRCGGGVRYYTNYFRGVRK